jgi:hypothetical protein
MTEERSRFPWNAQVLYGLLALSGFAFALFIPEQPLDYYFFELLVAVVGAAIPAVRRAGAISPLAGTAQVYWAVMWIWALLWLPWFFRLTDEQVRPLEKARRHPVADRFSPLIVILVIVYMYFLPFEGHAGRTMLGSIWGLAIIGSVLFASVPLFIRALVTWRRYLPILEPHEKNETEGERNV